MFFKQRVTESATLSYLFGCAGRGLGIAVDVVAGDEDWFLAEAEKAGAAIAHVIDTHVHADHYSGGLTLARRAGAAYWLHESNLGRVHFDFTPMTDGQRLEVGNACGVGLSGKPASTLGFERRCNPMLSMQREAFIAALTRDTAPQPQETARIVEANLRGGVPAEPAGA